MSIPVRPRVLHTFVRPAARWAMSPRASDAQLRRRTDVITWRPRRPRGVDIAPIDLAGIPAERHTPRGGATDLALLYLHGGGFMLGSPRSHRPLVAHLTRKLRATAYVPDYRLAPEHPFPAAIEDTVRAYRALLAQGWPANRIVVAGDSAGGTLTLLLALAARDRDDLPAPAALGLICPAADLTADGLARLPAVHPDSILTPALCARFFATYAAGADPADPLISPLRAELTGLPPVVVHSAAGDLIAGHSREVAARLRARGVPVRQREYPDLDHAFQVMSGLLTQADHALDDLAGDLRAALEDSTLKDTVLKDTTQPTQFRGLNDDPRTA
jgi:acetyl esterase/lipase